MARLDTQSGLLRIHGERIWLGFGQSHPLPSQHELIQIPLLPFGDHRAISHLILTCMTRIMYMLEDS